MVLDAFVLKRHGYFIDLLNFFLDQYRLHLIHPCPLKTVNPPLSQIHLISLAILLTTMTPRHLLMNLPLFILLDLTSLFQITSLDQSIIRTHQLPQRQLSRPLLPNHYIHCLRYHHSRHIPNLDHFHRFR